MPGQLLDVHAAWNQPHQAVPTQGCQHSPSHSEATQTSTTYSKCRTQMCTFAHLHGTNVLLMQGPSKPLARQGKETTSKSARDSTAAPHCSRPAACKPVRQAKTRQHPNQDSSISAWSGHASGSPPPRCSVLPRCKKVCALTRSTPLNALTPTAQRLPCNRQTAHQDRGHALGSLGNNMQPQETCVLDHVSWQPTTVHQLWLCHHSDHHRAVVVTNPHK